MAIAPTQLASTIYIHKCPAPRKLVAQALNQPRLLFHQCVFYASVNEQTRLFVQDVVIEGCYVALYNGKASATIATTSSIFELTASNASGNCLGLQRYLRQI